MPPENLIVSQSKGGSAFPGPRAAPSKTPWPALRQVADKTSFRDIRLNRFSLFRQKFGP